MDATRASLTPSEWARLIECRWVESDDALTSEADVAAAVRPGDPVLPHRPGVGPYVAALDVSTRRDLTALVVGHAEQRHGSRHVVIDRVVSWDPSAGGRVDLDEVERTTLRLCREYHVQRLRFARMQAEQLSHNVARHGVLVRDYVFSSAGANRLARSVFNALRDRALELPDDATTREQFVATRLVESGPGVVKLQNLLGQHDDIVTAMGMVVVDLQASPAVGGGISRAGGHRLPTQHHYADALRVSLPGTTRSGRAALGVSASGTPTDWKLRQAARTSPKGLPGGPIIGVPGAHDDPNQPKPTHDRNHNQKGGGHR